MKKTSVRTKRGWKPRRVPLAHADGRPVTKRELARQVAIHRSIMGKHSLEAWGKRLACLKGEYTGGWEAYTEEMGQYCLQDVKVCEILRRKLVSENRTNPAALATEHQFARICQQMEEHGIAFDVVAAQKL